MPFTTYDRDNCAVRNGGGFWYKHRYWRCAYCGVNVKRGTDTDFRWNGVHQDEKGMYIHNIELQSTRMWLTC